MTPNQNRPKRMLLKILTLGYASCFIFAILNFEISVLLVVEFSFYKYFIISARMSFSFLMVTVKY